MSRRLYLGRLPPDARSEDVHKFFDGFGHVVDCRVMTGFGFVEFETPKAGALIALVSESHRCEQEAEEAVQNYNGKSFMGTNIVVEFAKESRPRRDAYDDRGHGPRTRRPAGIRLTVTGVSRDTSWQDLKDFGRDAGSVSFADIDRDYPGQGVLEYLSREDADRAIRELDGRELRGRPVRVALDDSRGSGPDNYRREDRREDRYREDRYRRDRSRSPPRRPDYDDRRPRSPPYRREEHEKRPAGYDDYRRGGYDDRKPSDYYYDRRRDEYDRRRDDRRRDEKDDRYDDRAPRHANGESGWSR
ncbi:hypothetical protein NP233_g3994 [Leucocoprinus birnbaumii]|uniref:RRM domain-containing protein n=1 Tax=Leucocoprinus birnbaumii TaxID=56174 RepID=A0AAD5VY68_9AGAR|nr:hypothetical protein NP233_g3994 [Leucocoprinus birnbaumii]